MQLSIVIQAGGASSRMGRDKALLLFDGRPMVEHLIHRLGHLSDDVVVISNRPEEFAYLDVPVYSDVLPVRGALPGLITAFTHARHDAVSVIACDMAFVNPEMLAAELALLADSGADAVVPHSGRGWEPFHAVYRRLECLAAAKAALEAGMMSASSWYASANVVEFDEALTHRHDPQGQAFLNFNTPQEYRALAGPAAAQALVEDVPGAGEAAVPGR